MKNKTAKSGNFVATVKNPATSPKATTPVPTKPKATLLVNKSFRAQIRRLCQIESVKEWSGTVFYKLSGKAFDDVESVVCEPLLVFPLDIGTAVYTEYEINEQILDAFITFPELKSEDGSVRTGHIHSHNAMSAFFSGTDDNELKNNVDAYSLYISIIVNNAGDIVAKGAFTETKRHTGNIEKKITDFLTGKVITYEVPVEDKEFKEVKTFEFKVEEEVEDLGSYYDFCVSKMKELKSRPIYPLINKYLTPSYTKPGTNLTVKGFNNTGNTWPQQELPFDRGYSPQNGLGFDGEYSYDDFEVPPYSAPVKNNEPEGKVQLYSTQTDTVSFPLGYAQFIEAFSNSIVNECLSEFLLFMSEGTGIQAVKFPAKNTTTQNVKLVLKVLFKNKVTAYPIKIDKFRGYLTNINNLRNIVRNALDGVSDYILYPNYKDLFDIPEFIDEVDDSIGIILNDMEIDLNSDLSLDTIELKIVEVLIDIITYVFCDEPSELENFK